jgi:protease II
MVFRVKAAVKQHKIRETEIVNSSLKWHWQSPAVLPERVTERWHYSTGIKTDVNDVDDELDLDNDDTMSVEAYRVSVDGTKRQVLLRASDFSRTTVFRQALSADESRIAVLARDTADEQGRVSLFVASLDSGRDVTRDDFRAVELPFSSQTITSVEFCDNDTLVFSHSSEDSTLVASSVTAVSLVNGASRLLFTETASDRGVDVFRTQDARYLVVRSESHTSSEFRALPIDRLSSAPIVVFPREFDSIAHLRHEHGRFWILHDVGRLRGRHTRLDALSDDALDWSARTPVLQDLPGYTIANFSVHAKDLLLFARSERTGLASLMALNNFVDLKPIETRPVVLDITSNYPHPTRASSVPIFTREVGLSRQHVLDLASMTLRTAEFPDPQALEHVVIEHHLVPSRSTSLEKIEVPMITIRARNAPLDGSAKCMQFVYGAYGDVWPFSLDAVDLTQIIDGGFSVAWCAVRGGGEKGEAWAADGTGDGNKENSFRDTVACSNFLVERGYAARDALCLFGHSAGAFTAMGAIKEAPTKYAAVICTRPLVDAASDDSELEQMDKHHWGSFSPPRELPALLQKHPSQFPSMFFYGSMSDPNTPFDPAMKLAILLATIAATQNPDFDARSPLIYFPVMETIHADTEHVPVLANMKARCYAFASSEIDRRRERKSD